MLILLNMLKVWVLNQKHVNSISELEEAFKRAKKSEVTYVISIKTHAYKVD
jgi:TPP-dependent trihydroxycyclohexane-1,2-dione (THcHDO) dehydratase